MDEAKTFTEIKLTTAQDKLWTESRTATLWAQPAFSDIWYSLMVDAKGQTAKLTNEKSIPVAATNGKSIFINPEGYFKYSLDERVFINCHEVLHAVLDHPRMFMAFRKAGKIKFLDGTELPYDNQTLQIAADLVINAILVDAKVGKAPADACYDPSKVTADMSVLDAYRKVYKKQQQQGGGGSKGKGGLPPGSFDTHLDPGEGEGENAQEAADQRNESEWQTGVAAAIASAKARGKLPAGLERLLAKVLQPEMDWTEMLRTALTRRIGNSGSSWNELDHHLIHRGIGAPGRIGYGAGYIVVGLDTSGSMTQAQMDKIMSETAGILDDVKPKRLVLVQCDASVHEAVECDDSGDLLQRKLKGGGGTDFRPVFDWIDKEGGTPDALIYFTDTWGVFPDHAPGYPVIWASLTKGATVPWGDYIDVPIKES